MTGAWRAAAALVADPVVRRPCESWRRRVEEVLALGRTEWLPLPPATEAREEWEEDSLSSTSVLREIVEPRR